MNRFQSTPDVPFKKNHARRLFIPLKFLTFHLQFKNATAWRKGGISLHYEVQQKTKWQLSWNVLSLNGFICIKTQNRNEISTKTQNASFSFDPVKTDRLKIPPPMNFKMQFRKTAIFIHLEQTPTISFPKNGKQGGLSGSSSKSPEIKAKQRLLQNGVD